MLQDRGLSMVGKLHNVGYHLFTFCTGPGLENRIWRI